MMRNILAAVVLAAVSGCSWMGVETHDTSAVSPDGRNEIRLYLKPLSYEVKRDGKTVVAKTPISIRIAGKRIAREAEETEPVVSTGRVMGKFFPAIYKKHKVFESGYETIVDFGKWGVHLMARDDGVAYRFETRYKEERIRVVDERAGFTVPDSRAQCWVHFTRSFGYEETKCQSLKADDVKTDHNRQRMVYAPFLYRVGNTTVAVLETDVFDYPVRYFDEAESSGFGTASFKSVFAGWPKRTHHEADGGTRVERGGRRVVVEKHADWLVETDGTRNFPWRAFALADRSVQLVENDIAYALARPIDKDADFSWVKPGKVAWDWWNAFDNKGDPEGCTTETYLRFVDFAAKKGVKYVILDEGWSEKLDIWRFNPRVDVPKRIDGHLNVAGCQLSNTSIEEAIETLKSTINRGTRRGAFCQAGREGVQGRFHRPCRCRCSGIPVEVRRGLPQEQDACRLPRRLPSNWLKAVLSKCPKLRGCAWARADEVE